MKKTERRREWFNLGVPGTVMIISGKQGNTITWHSREVCVKSQVIDVNTIHLYIKHLFTLLILNLIYIPHKMEAGSSTVQTTSEPQPLAPSKLGRSVGKAHKSSKTALKRSYISPSVKTPFEKRKEQDKAREATRMVEQEMKEETKAEQERCVSLLPKM